MLSIVYLTSREDPKFEWFIESLCLQLSERPIRVQVIFVDFFLQYDESRADKLKQLINHRFHFHHVPPKPTPWQGKYRLTKDDWFAASNARNTGIALAMWDYVAFCDDISILMPGWLDQVCHAMEHRYIVAGAYKKVKNLVVENGKVVSYDEHPQGVDSRWGHGSSSGIVPMHPGGLYGCSFGTPLKKLLEVNGLDEACDGQGGEDYDLSIRMTRTGIQFYYNRNMLTYESEELHHVGKIMKRVIKPPRQIGKNKDGTPIMSKDASHVILDQVNNDYKRYTPIGNNYNLSKLRETVLFQKKPFPTDVYPKKHWFDGQLLSEM